MTVQKLQELLQELINNGTIKPDSELCFRHSIHESESIYSAVDYVLVDQKPGVLALCYDDGHW